MTRTPTPTTSWWRSPRICWGPTGYRSTCAAPIPEVSNEYWCDGRRGGECPDSPQRSLFVENHDDVECCAGGARSLGRQGQYFAMSGDCANGRPDYFAALLQIRPDGGAVEPLQRQRIVVRRSRDLVVFAVVFERRLPGRG